MILSSDDIRSTSFGIERKGYNKAEVDSFLDRVGRSISQLEETERILRRQLESNETADSSAEGDSSSPGEPTDFVAVGEEVTAILQTARDSATTMRTTAEAEATTIRQKAEEYAAECRRSAETDAEELRGAAAITASALKSEAQQDRTEAEIAAREANERATTLRAEAEQKASQVVESAEQQAADLVATATETADSEYRDALAAAQQRMTDAQGTEQEILYSLTAVHSDVGAAIARLDQEARSAPAPAAAPTETDESETESGDQSDRTDEPAEGDQADEPDEHPAETELERTTRQVTGGLAESLRETAGVSGPVGALFGLSDTDQSGDEAAEGDDTAASAATPTEPDTIDLRDQPDAVQSLAESDDPLADLVKQAVGKAVERAADQEREDE
jgi:DivIVA domain-containing protein